LREFKLVEAKAFPEEPAGAVANHGAADAGAGDDAQPGMGGWGKPQPIGNETAMGQPASTLTDAREIPTLLDPGRAAEAEARWGFGVHEIQRSGPSQGNPINPGPTGRARWRAAESAGLFAWFRCGVQAGAGRLHRGEAFAADAAAVAEDSFAALGGVAAEKTVLPPAADLRGLILSLHICCLIKNR